MTKRFEVQVHQNQSSRTMFRVTLVALLLTLTVTVVESAATAPAWKKIPGAVVIQSRRLLNFGGLFGSATQASPYERITSHPVFAVSTPWGSPYMNMEKLSDMDEYVKTDSGGGSTPQSLSEEQNEYRTVALYFMDPDDVLAVHGEMKQMEQMEKTDIRITAISLAKALRQASNLGNGLLTGAPPDPLDGNLKIDEGGSLRYKIVPPKRQLYYAARCIGKERVGLFGETGAEDAQTAILGNSALESVNLMRRREKRERKTAKPRNAMEAANAHMEGYSGIPVFYVPQMRRTLPLLKRIATGTKHETPFFFNYEDMEVAWEHMRSRSQKSKAVPEKPVNVEVFNLWDVLTSMDRDDWKKRQQKRKWIKQPLGAIKDRLPSSGPLGLESITFVPSSRSTKYKEAITARGNGKARLRPMR
jgi:hypothetical protein